MVFLFSLPERGRGNSYLNDQPGIPGYEFFTENLATLRNDFSCDKADIQQKEFLKKITFDTLRKKCALYNLEDSGAFINYLWFSGIDQIGYQYFPDE
jgi:hypothetical protein